MLSKQKQKNPVIRRAISLAKKAWERFAFRTLSWMASIHLAKSQRSSNSRSSSLTKQINDIALDTLKRIKIFALSVRVLICFLLLIIIGVVVATGLYSLKASWIPSSILFVYAVSVGIMLRRVVFVSNTKRLQSNLDLWYVTAEILAVYLAIVFFPTHHANIFTTSLKGLWSLLIILATFTGKWYYGFYSGGLVAALNASLAFFYPEVRQEFAKHGIDFNQVAPYVQIFVLSGYYFFQGALLALPFFLFEKAQSTVVHMKVEQIVAKPYYDLALPDGFFLCGSYLISVTCSTQDIVGADFVCIRRNNNDFALIVGDVIGHGLNRSPGAIMSMSVFKSLYTAEPLFIQESLNRLMQNLDVSSGGKLLCVSLKLHEDGYVEYAGKADSMYVTTEKGTSMDLHPVGEVLGLTPDLSITQTKIIQMEDGDTIFIKTDGVKEKQDDKTIVIIRRIKPEEIEQAKKLADKIL